MTSPRTFRLQFSLRALLVLMALVGVGIVVYRRPWTVEVEDKESRTTSQYRRAWNGKPVKHGVEIKQFFGGFTWHHWFEEGQLLKEQGFRSGALICESHWRNGKMHGPFWSKGDEERVGDYDQGELHGKWTVTSSDEIRHEEYHHGKVHGRQEWRTRAGRVLQTAEFDQGRLVKWNDREVAAEVRRWVETNVTDTEQRVTLLTPINGSNVSRGAITNFGETVYEVGSPTRQLNVLWGMGIPEIEDRMGSPLCEALLETALLTNQTLTYRFNTVFILPIEADHLDWQDRTGVADVQFEKDSPQEHAWLEPRSVNAFLNVPEGDRFQRIFEPYSTTGIDIDATAIADLSKKYSIGSGPAPPGPFPEHPRRDLLGIFLELGGYYCEQQGNTLVIKRRE